MTKIRRILIMPKVYKSMCVLASICIAGLGLYYDRDLTGTAILACVFLIPVFGNKISKVLSQVKGK